MDQTAEFGLLALKKPFENTGQTRQFALPFLRGFMAKDHLERVRKFCLALPEVEEKLSHGAPTFFVKKKVFVMFADNHHNDGHIAIWSAATIEVQQALIEAEPDKFFIPLYVVVGGCIGINLNRVIDKELASHIRQAWLMIAPSKLHALLRETGRGA